ncbi:putative glutamine-dependent NAD(+) synthetase [Nitrospira sp. ND1]|uniref:NAD+ synthase n=1 Tax=Nitrospira sp. ND1 TaxID=1658518 RepID=UPI0009BAE0FB|nr:NAD+ synthase [Nitrospira sp. ND1]SLM43139.1 putative glutamine-dependent NAD(+) synthetase [Nitrospira sp. ND1]
MRSLRIAMAQINPTVGDIVGNTRLIQTWIKEARQAKADLVAFPELAITGYPPEDLLFKPRFIEDTHRALRAVAAEARGVVVVVGYVGQGATAVLTSDAPSFPLAGRHELYNEAAVLSDRRILATYRKRHLPNYGVFDESRYFHPGSRLPLLVLNGVTIGVNICEDIWFSDGPTRAQAAAGAEVIVNINASPFHVGKGRMREQVLATRARENRVIVTYTNTVGGQDELVFDGCSMIVDQAGEIVGRGKAFEQDLIVADLDVAAVGRARLTQGRKRPLPPRVAALIDRVDVRLPARKLQSVVVPDLEPPLGRLDEAYRALVLGVQDYVRKNGFKRVVIGLSGGVDSAITAVIAVDALGAENVLGVFMPSPYTSRASREDVADLASRLHIQVDTLSITATFKSYLRALSRSFKGRRPDTTEENLQARIRGNLLMAYSNKFGHLVLTTGNKSEMSVGYATLYGDMAGGFAVIKDVPKTMVYELSHMRNQVGPAPAIPKRVLERAPTAELRPDQKDEDSLPPYAILDPILKAYVEEDRALEDITAMGFDRETVARVIVLVDRSEYKRRQAPLGIKITHRAFGKDRRMPITNGYR